MPQRLPVVIMKNRKSERLRLALSEDCTYVYLSDLKFPLLQRLLSESGRVVASRDSNENFYRLAAKQIAREFADQEIVIVSLDNTNRLAAEFRRTGLNCPIVLVQHGTNSTQYGAPDALTLPNSLLLCFGKREISQYVLSGCRPEVAVPVGSLLNSHYLRSKPRIPMARVEARVCIISEFRSDGAEQLDDYMVTRQDSWDSLLENIQSLPKVLPLQLHVALRPHEFGSGSVADQVAYFKKRLGNDVTFSAPDSPFSSYSASDCSQVTLGVMSAALIESLGRGNKVIFSNPLEDDRLNSPLQGICEHRGGHNSSLLERIGEVYQLQHPDFESRILPSVEHVIERRVDAVTAVKTATQMLGSGKSIEDLATGLSPLVAKSQI